MRRFKLSMPSPAMIVACLALIAALGGTAYAAIAKNSIKSRQIAPKAVKTSDLADNAVKEAKIKDGAVSTDKLADGAVSAAKIADGTISGGKLEARSVKLGSLGVFVNTYFTDAPLPDDGTRNAAFAQCPTGQVVIGGGASFSFPTAVNTTGDDLRLISSRPALAPAPGDFPAQGSGFNGWRVTAINLAGGATDGTTQVTSHVTCLSDTPGIP
jgi:hypothetical protein